MKWFGRRISALCALLLFIPAAHAWTTHDSAWETAYMAAHLTDWGQTRDIAANCDSDSSYYEKNPLLGDCPSATSVDLYFLSTALLHAKVAQMLSPRYRRMFQVGTLGLQINSINNNKRIGLKIAF